MSGYQLFKDALSTYRDVKTAERQQPMLVQGVQQVQVPMARNPVAAIDSKAPFVPAQAQAFMQSNAGKLVMLGGVLVGGALLYSLIK